MKGFEHKKCPFCASKEVWKYGKRNGRQRYRCKACLKRFDGVAKMLPSVLWKRYSEDKQTMQQLAEQYGRSRKTIARYLKKAQPEPAFPSPKAANLIIDTTYFKRGYGVMVLLDAVSKQALFVEGVVYETNALYLEAIQSLEKKGIEIKSITCDGRRGLDTLLPGIPMQMCHFHQVQIINRYLTRNPKSVAACALRALVLNLKNSTETSFKEALAAWHMQHKTYLNERSTHPVTGRSHYTHKRLRSAYNSLKRNLEGLFTYERHPELCIPKTTNLLEGRFADLKGKLRCHQGMKKENKILFIKDYFSKK